MSWSPALDASVLAVVILGGIALEELARSRRKVSAHARPEK